MKSQIFYIFTEKKKEKKKHTNILNQKFSSLDFSGTS